MLVAVGLARHLTVSVSSAISNYPFAVVGHAPICAMLFLVSGKLGTERCLTK